jgi:hypothetical protein
VHEVIAERVTDGQLDACGLTLKDLAVLEETFTRTLTLGVFHNRIDYPPVGRSLPGGGDRHAARTGYLGGLSGLADRSA